MAHGQIGMVPAAENAKTLEVALVLLHIFRRVVAATLAEFRRRHFSFAAQFLFHLSFDRQTVAIPSGHVRRVMARHAFGLDDHVFQNFVQPGAQVNRAGGIGRSIMEHEERLAFARLQDALVQFRFLPGLKLFRLVLRQARLHGKVRLRQV